MKVKIKPATIKLPCGQEHEPHLLDSAVSLYQWFKLHRLFCDVCAKVKL